MEPWHPRPSSAPSCVARLVEVTMSTLDWKPLTEADLTALTHLAACCLEKDGGLPLLATEPMLRQLFLSGQSVGGRDETGDMVAAASVFVDASGHRAATGL